MVIALRTQSLLQASLVPKTTGFQRAIPRLPNETSVLIMVPTKLDAEQMYQAVEDLCPGEVGVWMLSKRPRLC